MNWLKIDSISGKFDRILCRGNSLGADPKIKGDNNYQVVCAKKSRLSEFFVHYNPMATTRNIRRQKIRAGGPKF